MTRGSVVLFVFCLLPLSLASTARAQTQCASTAGERDGALSIEGTEYAARPRPDAWRQLGGPHRNFRVDSAAVATAWGAGGPTRLWSRSLGEGYSSILADGDLLVTMYRKDDDEVIIALDAATGATRWQYAYHTPLVHNGYFRGDLVQQPHAGALRQRPAPRRARARQHGRLRPGIRGRARRRDRGGGVAGAHLRPGADAGRRRPPRHPRRGRGVGRGIGHPERTAGARARGGADLQRLDPAHPRGQHVVRARPAPNPGPRSRRPGTAAAERR
jgi:hypothetical protein